jgi:hypothetical protein
MKILLTSAALIALAAIAPAQAQVLGGAGAGVTSGLSGQAGTAPLGTGATGQVNGSPTVGAPILPGAAGATQNGVAAAPGAINAPKTPPGVIKDGRTLSTGSASVNTSANVADPGAKSRAMLTGGMAIQDMGGMSLGKVISVAKSRSGQVSNVIIQTTDGVRRSMPAGSLTVKGGVAVTSQSEADLVGFPASR